MPQMEFHVPCTRFSWFIPVSIVTDSGTILVSHRLMGSAPYRGLQSNGTILYLSENPFLFPPKFPDFVLTKWKAPNNHFIIMTILLLNFSDGVNLHWSVCFSSRAKRIFPVSSLDTYGPHTELYIHLVFQYEIARRAIPVIWYISGLNVAFQSIAEAEVIHLTTIEWGWVHVWCEEFCRSRSM